MIKYDKLIKLIIGLVAISPTQASEGHSILSHPVPINHSLRNEVITKSKTVTCQDGKNFQFPQNLNNAQEIEVANAKCDGPVVYIEDKNGYLYSFSVDNGNTLTRTQIFRLPFLGDLYALFCNPSNNFTIAKNHDGSPVKWAISYATYPDAAYTISVFEMTSCYPVKLRNRDPWLPPYFYYQHIGPMDFVGIDITASGERVAISGYTLEGEKGFSHRRINYDLSGNNPLMDYRLPSDGKWQPSKRLRPLQKLGVTTTTVPIPTEDWSFVPLKNNHAPNILAIDGGRYILVPKHEGGHDAYDCLAKKWCSKTFDQYTLTADSWASFPSNLKVQPKRIKANVNGMSGYIELSSQEPLYGVFKSTSLEKTLEIPLYLVARTFEEAILFNQQKFVDNQGKDIQVKLKGFD